MEKIKVSIVKNGIQPFININGKLFNSLSFKTFRPTDKNISDFYKAGIRLFDILSTGTTSSVKEIKYSLFGESWIDDETYNFDVIDNQIDLFVKNAPDAYFGIMLVLDTREWWLKKRKGYPNSFTNLGQMFMDPEWNRLAGLYLKRAVEHIEDKYGDKVYSYYLLCGHTTEWFSMNNELPSKFIEEDIKRKKLDITLPDEKEINKTLDRILLNDEQDSNIIKYRKYLNNAKVNSILNFARIVKNATNNNKLVGLYYGYSTEVGHRMLLNHGNVEYERVFLSDDIDIICSPMSYQYRKLEDAPSAMITYSTVNERNKIYFLEFDYSLFGSKGSVPVYGHSEATKNYDESIAILDREFVYSLAQGSGFWWFDMFEGWFYDDTLMNRIQKQINISNSLKKDKFNSNSEVAAVIDIDSMYYCNKNNNLHLSTIFFQRKGLGLAGCSYDLYSSCDLNLVNKKQYKIAFFLNLFEICSEKSKQIDELEKNKTVVYVCAPGFIKDGNFSLENCCKRAHMNLKKQEYESQISLINGDFINCEPSGPIDNYVPVGDFLLYIDDPDVIPLGYFTKSKNVAVGYKKFGNHYVVFSALGDLPSSLLRQIYELAGVHLYSKGDDVAIFNNDKLIGVYHTKECDAQIYTKDNDKLIDMLNGKEYVPVNRVINIKYSNKERTKLLIKKGD